MAANTIPQARQALYDLMVGEFQDDDVLVADGVPRERAAREVKLGGMGGPTVEAEERYAAIGGERRQQTYTLQLVFDVYDRGADDGHAVTQTAWEMFERARAAVHRDVTLGVEDLMAEVGRFDQPDPALPAAEGGFGVTVTADVQIVATVTST